MALIKEFKGKSPKWGTNCYFSENATLIGDITMGDDCSVWFSAVIRADVDCVKMGNRVNVQDNACIHQAGGFPAILEDDVTLGHGAIVHACTVRKGALIGMNAVVLDGAEVGEGAVVAAGAVVLGKTKIGAHEIWAGVPAKKMNKAADPGEAEWFADEYVKLKEYYK